MAIFDTGFCRRCGDPINHSDDYCIYCWEEPKVEYKAHQPKETSRAKNTNK